jgi:transcriptional regulator with XRE-family HTH domain
MLEIGGRMLAREWDVLLIQRRRLSTELRRLREQAGLSGRQLAERIGISQSKISRIESGATMPTVPEVNTWAVAVDASADTTEKLLMLTDAAYTEVHPWDTAMRDRPHLQDDIQEIENRAGTKLVYEPSVVPGLLQTAEYARRVFTMFEPTYAELDIPAVVAGRLDRQIALFDRGRRFGFLITEAALRLRVGPPAMMASQLDRIGSLSTLENVSVGLIPQDAQAVTHVPHGFVIFEPANRKTEDALVLVETVHANLTVSEPGHVALYRRQWSLLEEMAVYDGAARELLAVISADIRMARPGGEPLEGGAAWVPGGRRAPRCGHARTVHRQICASMCRTRRTTYTAGSARGSACCTRRSRTRGQLLSRTCRRWAAYSRRLNTRHWPVLVSVMTYTPATFRTTMQPPPPLHLAGLSSAQLSFSIISPYLHCFSAPRFLEQGKFRAISVLGTFAHGRH